ncbi:S1C family serine protease [Priestia abyssalis]|uniref:S1C family serine protease n=1 Tax=Priestia abyssalis TaxID=1221450 RepID=UPI000994AD93|nr:trypsin-like peptidase domain-containing protein [Priestia abyssalis]
MNLHEYENNKQTPKQRRSFPPLFASLTGAIVGSVATLYLAPALGMSGISPITESIDQEKTAIVEQSEASENTLQLQQTSTTSNSMINAIENVREAVVGVVNIQQQTNYFSHGPQSSQEQGTEQESGTGSGVIFKKSGDDAYIITNNHVIEGASKVEISLSTGERIAAEVVGADQLTDLAVLKIESKYATKVADFGDSSSLRIGEQVAAIGNPLGLDLSSTVTQGIVSNTDRTIPVSTSGGEWDLNVVQTDAAINPGNSGGALINSAGQVIGINSLKIAEDGVEGLGFAIPSQDVKPVIEDLLQYGEVKRPYLGVGLQSLSDFPSTIQEQLNLPEDTQGGVIVTSVEPASPAAEAGLQIKDLITTVNGTKVNSIGELRKYIYTEAKIGDQIKVELYRDGKKINVSVKMSEKGM